MRVLLRSVPPCVVRITHARAVSLFAAAAAVAATVLAVTARSVSPVGRSLVVAKLVSWTEDSQSSAISQSVLKPTPD